MSKIPIADKGMICPLHKKDVSQVCHKCSWYTQIRGKNPQSTQEIDEWGCAIAWGPILAIEIAQKTNSVGAAVESFRNEMKEDNQLLLELENMKPKMLRG